MHHTQYTYTRRLRVRLRIDSRGVVFQAGLELPVAVTRGTVGRISLTVPWSSLWSSPLVVTVSDVLVLAAPVASRPYDPDLEQRLARAAKRSAVSRLERDDAIPGQLRDGETGSKVTRRHHPRSEERRERGQKVTGTDLISHAAEIRTYIRLNRITLRN